MDLPVSEADWLLTRILDRRKDEAAAIKAAAATASRSRGKKK